ncbi:hypothetical protein B7463_g7909, partial [Scytalidium lignicola]
MGDLPYSKFSDATREYRLLRLKPALGAVQCQLIHATLDHIVKYEALSYTWGDPNDLHSEPIMLNNRPYQVTRNLHAALCALREGQEEPRMLWIDALCINQKDLAERNGQVLMMPQIYSHASLVLIWLGDECNGSTEAMQLFCRASVEGLSSCQFTDEVGKKKLGLRYGVSQPHVLEPEAKIESTTVTALIDLLNRPWFTRVWIVQEFLLGLRHTRILLCGKDSVPWPQLERVFNDTKPSTWRTGGADAVLISRGYIAMMKFQDFARDNMNSLALIDLFRSFNATDPRDKIYGMLGLLSDSERSEIQPDYRNTVDEIYTRFAKQWIKKTRSLEILSSCQFNPIQRKLNSWVPDWDNKILALPQKATYARLSDVIRMPFLRAGQTARCRIHTVTTEPREHLFKLTTAALSLGVVDRVWKVEAWWQLNRANPGQGLNSAFWEAIFAYTIDTTANDQDDPNLREQDEFINVSMKNLSPEHSTIDRSWALAASVYLISRTIRNRSQSSEMLAFAAITEGRQYFETTNGHMGLVDRAVAIGDPVFYVPGAKLPVVMAPAQAGCHRLKGDCYIHILKPGLDNGRYYTLDLDGAFGQTCQEMKDEITII